MPSAASVQKLVTKHARGLSKRVDDGNDAVQALYAELAPKATADSTEGRLASRLHEIVADARIWAHQRGAADLTVEIRKFDGEQADLPGGAAPKRKDVDQYIRDAAAEAVEAARQAEAAEQDPGAAFVHEAYRAEVIVEAETVNAYEASRSAGYEALEKQADDDARGYRLARSQDDLGAHSRISVAAEKKSAVAVLGERWSAVNDRRTCSVCRSADGEMKLVGVGDFSQPGPSAHPRCRCMTHLWAVGWPWTAEKDSEAMTDTDAVPTAKFERAGTIALHSAAWGQQFEARKPDDVEALGGIAVVTIRGPLTHHAEWFWDSYDGIAERFREAIGSADTVVLRIDSPGGDVFGLFELAKQMRASASAAGKKIVAYADGMAASAAYAIACAADEVYVPSTGWIGSVGVITVRADVTKANEQFGIGFDVITSGKRKADGLPIKPMTPDERKALQAHVDELAAVFFDWVAERRGSDAASVKALEAGIFQGQSAVKAGLADAVMDFDELIASLTKSGNQKASAMAALEQFTAPVQLSGGHMPQEANLRGAQAAPVDNATAFASQGEIVMSDKQNQGTTPSPELAEANKKIGALETEVKGMSEKVGAAQKAEAKLLELTGKASFSEALGTVSAWQKSHERIPELEKGLADANAELAARAKAERDASVAALIDGAFNAGKLTPAERDSFKARGYESEEDISWLKAHMETLSVRSEVKPAVQQPADPGAANANLTEADREVMKAMGLTEEQMIAAKKGA